MFFYRKLLFPIFQQFDAERTHEWILSLLAFAQRGPAGRLLLRSMAGKVPDRPVQVFGLTFPNVLGVAAGFDKDARVAAGLFQLGFGHVEVGTLTPRPQAGNARPRIFRLPQDGALINRMGFPNEGVAAVVPRLRHLAATKGKFIVGVSLGKQKETPLAEAAEDYTAVMRAVYPYADYLAINVSSPNTPGLRELQGGNYLEQLLAHLAAENDSLAMTHHLTARPLLLKIAPDLTGPEVEEIVAVAQATRVGGIIAANTTVRRVGLTGAHRSEAGGLSGRPLAQRNLEIIRAIRRQAGDRLPVIGVGGAFTAADVQARLHAGAALVQVYTGLIYEGPCITGRILRCLARRETSL